jgi:hypothetical protein
MAIWYSLWSFDIFSPFWYVWTKTNLATLSVPSNKSMPENADILDWVFFNIFGSMP